MTTVNARDPAYAGGVLADGTSDDTAAINAALAAVGTTGGDVLMPSGRIKTTGGHVIPVGVVVRGVRRGITGDGTAKGTSFRHRGSGYCFKLTDETSGGAGCGLEDVCIYGSSATDAAIAGASGVEIGNGLRLNLERVWIEAFTGVGSVGLRFHNTTGTILYSEHHHIRNVTVINCSKCIQFLSDGGGAGTSFGYSQLIDVNCQVYANQIAYDFAGPANFYNSRIFGQIHYTGNNAIGFNVAAAASIYQGTSIDIVGEMLGVYTGCNRIKNAGTVRMRGRFFIANGQPVDDFSVALAHEFVEQELTPLELPAFSIAPVSTVLTVPAGRPAWNVTGAGPTNVFAGVGAWEGRVFTLKFAGAHTVTHTAGLIHLAGGANFVATANDTMTFCYIGGVAYEVARSVNAP